MAITIGGGVRARIREYRSSIVIQVKRASDVEAAEAALARARSDIADLGGGWQSAPGLSHGDRNAPTYVGNVVPTPGGPFVFIDGGHTPLELLATIPDIVARYLQQAGVRQAVVSFPLGIDTPLFKQGLVLDDPRVRPSSISIRRPLRWDQPLAFPRSGWPKPRHGSPRSSTARPAAGPQP